MKLPRSFWLLFLLVFFSQCIPAAYFVLPSVLSQWNFSAEQIGLLMSSFYFGATLARSLGGWLVEKYGVRRSVILSGGAGAALGLLFLVRDFHVLLLSRIAAGAAFGVLSVACVAYQGLMIPKADRGRLFALLGLAYIFPQFLVPLAELLIDGGWFNAFMLMTSAAFLLSGLFAAPLPRIRKESGERCQDRAAWGSWGELLRRRDTWSLIATTLALFSLNAATVQYVPSLIRTLGLKATLFTGLCTGVCIVLRFFGGGRVMTCCDRRALVCFCAMLEGAGLWMASQCSGAAGAVLSGLVFGVGNAFAFPCINALIPDVIPPHLIPKGTAAYLFAYDLAFISIPLAISTASAGRGLGAVLKYIAECSLAAFPLIYLFLWRRPPLRACLEKTGRP